MTRAVSLVLASLLAFPVAAQEPANPQQVQVMLQQLDLRRSEEMNRAITCEIGSQDLRRQIESLKTEVETLKQQKEK